MKTNSIKVSPDNASKMRDWLANRSGIAVWSNKDLGSPYVGAQTFTPVKSAEGLVIGPPHWNCGTSGPDFVITDIAQVSVETVKEVARVKVRQGPPYLGGINRADRAKLDKALAAAGEGAFWTPDYSTRDYGSAWFQAAISVPASIVPLADFTG